MTKNLFTILMLLVFSLSIKAQIANNWIAKQSMAGTDRQSAVGFNINGKGYFGTGQRTFYFQDFWEYDPITDAWTQVADFGGGQRSFAVGFSIGNLGYVGTGELSSTHYKDFWEYNPGNNLWTQKANIPGLERTAAVGFSIGLKGYLGTGVAGVNSTKNFYEYNPTLDTWVTKANFGGVGRHAAVGFNIDNKGYIGTGISSGSNFSDFWEYNPITNTWAQKASTIEGRNAATGLSVSGRGYIVSGFNNLNNPSENFWEYNPDNNTWKTKQNFSGQRFYASSFSIGNKGFVGLGNSNFNWYNSLYQIHPADLICTYTDNPIICAGTVVSVNYNTWNAVFTATNNLTLQLSNANGSFANPTNFSSTQSSNTFGTLSGTIPFNTPFGNKYRIRIISSKIDIIGEDNGNDITINPASTSSVNQTICTGNTYLFGNSNLSTTGVYSYTYVTNNDCDSIVVLNLTVISNDDFIVSSSLSKICIGDTTILNVTGVENPKWEPGAFIGNSIKVNPNKTTDYFVEGTKLNCVLKKSLTIVVDENCKKDTSQLKTYNCITPNGDGKNDFMYIEDIDKYPNNIVAIFNKWGVLITRIKNYNNETNFWNGTSNGSQYTAGSYFFIIEHNGKQIHNGFVEVLAN